jgi:hypothetical protein
VVLYNNSNHYTVIVGYDERPADPYWILLDSFGPQAGRPDGTRRTPMGGINFLHRTGGAYTNSLEVLSRLTLDLHPQGPPESLAVVPGAVALRGGQPLRLEARVRALPPVEYQWFRGGQPLPGRTGSVLDLAPAVAGVYEVEVRLRSLQRSLRSGPVRVEVDAAPAAPLRVQITPPDDPVVTEGGILILTATVAGPGPHAFQWLRDGRDLPGQTRGALFLEPVGRRDGGDYQLRVSHGDQMVVSAPVTIHVLETGPREDEEKR